MFALFFFVLAVLFTFGQLAIKKNWKGPYIAETFLGYILLFSLGVMALFAAYGHVFMGPKIAQLIGWESGSPFQFEMGMTNLSLGILGILSFWMRGKFWDAVIIGWSVLFLGCFVGHVRDYYINHNTAPYNIGFSIWLSDLFLPLLAIGLLLYLRMKTK